jgi:glycosyltransferase involved in cell wall biosynthesis
LKLAIITHRLTQRDGQGRVNYEVVTEAINRNHQVYVLATEIDPIIKTKVSWIEIPVKGFPTEFIRNLVFSQRSSEWLEKNPAVIDLVIANGTITKAKAAVNIVHFIHNSWLRSPYHIFRSRKDLYGLYQWFYTASNASWEQTTFNQAEALIAISQKIATELEGMNIHRDKIKVIPNGTDITEFCPGLQPRQQWDLPENVPLALFAGDIRFSRKNLDTVLKALCQVPDLHLAVAGITEGSPYLKMAESLGLSNRVHFLGLRQDVPQLMKAVDFLVFPSRYEPFGLVVIEALATGLPVITATTTGASSLVTPLAGIVLSDPDEVSGLATAMGKLADHPQLRVSMGEAARAIAEKHTWSQMAQTYLDLLENIITAKS